MVQAGSDAARKGEADGVEATAACREILSVSHAKPTPETGATAARPVDRRARQPGAVAAIVTRPAANHSCRHGGPTHDGA